MTKKPDGCNGLQGESFILQMMKKYILTMWKTVFRYKYLITIGVFLVWMIFFDKQSFFYQQKLDGELQALEKDTLFYSHEISEATRKLEELRGNKEAMEKLAREKYLMKRDDEDVFVIVPATPAATGNTAAE